MDDRAIGDLRNLRARDEALGTRERTLQELDVSVIRIRERGEAVERFFAQYDEARRRTRSAVEAAGAEVARRSQDVAEAEAVLAAERDDERKELARRALARAEDHRAVSESALARAQADAGQLEQEAQDRQDELPHLERDARELAPHLPGVAPPGSGVQSLIEWASNAHAALFVAVRQLETERERVIREANELASALLGEPTYGSTPAQALARVERRFA